MVESVFCLSVFLLLFSLSVIDIKNRLNKGENFVVAIKSNWVPLLLAAFILSIEIFIIKKQLEAGNFVPITIMSCIMLLMLFFIDSIYFYLINLVNKLKVTNNLIYVRDIDVNYSPAILSFLINQKLERKKDIVATILNICAKDAVKLESKDGKLLFVRTNKKVNLTPDEKYIYDYLLVEDKSKFSFSTWQNIVKREYDRLGFAKEDTGFMFMSLNHIITGALILMMIIIASSILFNIKVPVILGFNSLVIIFTFLGMYLLLKVLIIIFGISVPNRNWLNLYVFNRKIYSKKGIEELNKWEKFKKFVMDFTLIDEREIRSVIIYEKYLSYSLALNINKKYLKLDNEIINSFMEFDFYDSYLKDLLEPKEDNI